MKVKLIVFFCYFIFRSITSFAESDITKRGPINIVKNTLESGVIIQLQVDQAPLRIVLGELSRVSLVDIHYSVLTDELVSATCIGGIQKVMKCLLGKTQNIVFHYSPEKAKQYMAMPVDIWILGSSLAEATQNHRNDTTCKRELESSDLLSTKNNKQADKKLMADFLLRWEVNNPKKRADAIVDLAIKTAIDNTDVQDILLNAMDDEFAVVREQALFGWVFRKGEDALPELKQALLDPDMSVRMKAIDLTNNREILIQAITDSHSLVRKLAQMKLDELVNRANEN